MVCRRDERLGVEIRWALLPVLHEAVGAGPTYFFGSCELDYSHSIVLGGFELTS